MSTNTAENQKELEFVQKLSKSLKQIRDSVGNLSELPTSDKSSIVNSIKSLSLGTYEDPKIDPQIIIKKFEDRLI